MTGFNKMSNSEKKLLNYGIIIVAIALSWVFVYQPISKSIKVKQAQKYELVEQLQIMLDSQQLLKQQANKTKKFKRPNNKPFISWVDDQLDKQQLAQYVTRSEPKDSKTLILTFENVVFDQLAKWLQNLEQNYAISIPEADINLIDIDNGLCNVRLTLEE